MNFRKTSFAIIVALLAWAGKVSAQKLYFITNSNDTVACSSLSMVPFKPAFKYKLTDDDTTHKIATYAVKEYRDQKTIYIKRWIPHFNASLFLQWIGRGKLNVYANVIPAGYSNIIEYYAGKKDDSVAYQIKTNGFLRTREERKNAFTSLIADAPEVAEMFKADSTYTIGNLLGTVKNYNLYHSDADVFFVNKKNDTTRCKIIFGKDHLLYKTPSRAGLKPLNTDSINAYVIGKTLYYRQILPERVGPQFITRILKGKLDVFTDLKDNVYISKAGAELIKVKGEKETSRHEDAFFFLIADNPAISNKYKNKSYNDDNLIQMIREYNGDRP